jgi:glycosyltransferase involved in cell wall biosynthesis
MKIGLLADRPIEVSAASTAHYLFQSLRNAFEVQHLGAEEIAHDFGSKSLLHRFKSWAERDSLLDSAARKYVRSAKLEYEKDPCDVLISVFASRFVPEFMVPPELPFVHLSDATPVLRKEPHSRSFQEELMEVERETLARARLCVYPSSWAAESATRDFGVDSERVHVIEWGGANEEEPITFVDQRPDPGATIELLFIGRQQKRKGLDRVVAALDQLIEMGRSVRLTVIGDRLPRQFRRECVEDHGSLSLDVPEERAKFEEAFSRATCLIHPARMEPYGHVLVESCARGVPVICTRVGGMPTIIADGVNGLLLPPEPTNESICEAILRVADDADLARTLGAGGRRAWEDRLCWARWIERMKPLLESLVT